MSHIITTIPADYFAQWKPTENDPRIARYLGMHDGTTLRAFNKNNGYEEDRPEFDEKPWFWMATLPKLPKEKLDDGNSVCFMVYRGRVIGYFDIIGVGTKRTYAWYPDEDPSTRQRLDDYCVALANWHPGDYGPMPGFQGWRYTELRP